MEKVEKCPYCGKLLKKKYEKEKISSISKIPTEVKCPKCGEIKVWKAGHHTAPSGEVLQRFMCRKCGYKFSRY